MVTAPEDRKKLIRKLIKLTGYTKDTLKYVPGFFIDKNTGALDYSGDNVPSISHGTNWCNNAGIGILIRNIDGQAVAIQIRRDTASKGNRYCWFTSILLSTVWIMMAAAHLEQQKILLFQKIHKHAFVSQKEGLNPKSLQQTEILLSQSRVYPLGKALMR